MRSMPSGFVPATAKDGTEAEKQMAVGARREGASRRSIATAIAGVPAPAVVPLIAVREWSEFVSAP